MSTGLIILISIILIAIIIVQLGRVSELSAKIRGEEDVEIQNTKRNAIGMLVFGALFLIGTVVSAYYYKNYMLGYGPHVSASEHGGVLDSMFNITLLATVPVFIVTHIALFWFTYKYRYQKGNKALFMPHDNRLEIFWTVIPAIVMVLLVIKGLFAWNEIMADVDPNEDYIEIEATGMQFAWLLRYPGADGKLGSKEFTEISSLNPLGQIWSDTKNLDDLQPNDIVLPVGKKVKVSIHSRDVLHNFDIPHMRVKMDAVPGIPTRFVFTPTITTEEYRELLRPYPEYQVPSDPEDPDGPQLWETFEYELACAELCGKGHFSMRKLVRIVSQEEYDTWLKEQKPYYLTTIRESAEDPFKGELLNIDIADRKTAFMSSFNKALKAEADDARIMRLNHVNFETGSARLTPNSKFELTNVVEAMKAHTNLDIEIGGHTDNTGDAGANKILSQSRADAVKSFITNGGIDMNRLKSIGYGQTRPIESNDSEEGRASNRRTEFKIISK